MSLLWSVIFLQSSPIFVSWAVFLTKLLTLGVLFSAAVNVEVVTEPLIFGILFSISLILAV